MDVLLETLGADGPADDRRALFGRFVGAWEFDVTNFLPDGGTTHGRGEWLWGWVLQGRAVQDVWMVPTRAEQLAGAEVREYGTTVRFYDPSIDAWRVVWSGPLAGRQIMFVARAEDARIVMNGVEGADVRLQWIFSEITETSFRWHAQTTADDGAGWQRVQEMRVRRATRE